MIYPKGPRMCVAEIRNGRPYRILKHQKEQFKVEGEFKSMLLAEAVRAIREQVYEAAKGKCKYCGRETPWEIGHMHEEHSKGNGGEVNCQNSVWTCRSCHIDVAHGDRKWQSARIDKQK